MSLIHNAHSSLDEYLLQWTEETLKRQSIRFHFRFARVPETHKPVDIKANRLHPPFHPAFFPVSPAVVCQWSPQTHCQVKWRSWNTTQRPFHLGNHPPFLPTPGTPEKVKVATATGAFFWEKENHPLQSHETPVEPSPLYPGMPERYPFDCPAQPALKGPHCRWIYKPPDIPGLNGHPEVILPISSH